MDHFLICENPACRFVVDSNVAGESPKRHPFVLIRCPECGSGWSSACPLSNRPLIVHWTDGVPHCLCCDRKLLGKDAQSAATAA